MPQEGERLTRASDGTTIKLEGCALPPWSVKVQDGWNPRKFDNPSPAMREADESLERSIRARISQGLPGILKAIQVKYIRSSANWRGQAVNGGIALLVDGERRLRIYRKIWDEGLHANIPVMDTETGATEAQLRAATIIANDNFPLTQLEIGLQCKILRDGCCQKVEWIAENIGKPVRFVTEAIALHEAPEEAKALVAAGEVTPAAVRGALSAEVKQAKAENRAPEPERIVEPLKAAVAARPLPQPPAQTSIPGTAKPAKAPKPVARPKALSERERKLQEPPAAPQAAVQQPAPTLCTTDMLKLKAIGFELARTVLDEGLYSDLERLSLQFYQTARVKYIPKKVQ